MKGRINRLFLLTAVAASCGVAPAFADIYSFKDERGVVHFTNITPSDKRFKMIRREANNPAPMMPDRSIQPLRRRLKSL